MASERNHNSLPRDRSSIRKLDKLMGVFRRKKDPDNSSQNISQSAPSADFESSAHNSLDGQDSDLAADQRKQPSPIKHSYSVDGVDAKAKNQSDDLWEHAYDILKLRDPELVTAYERYLVSADDSTSTSSSSPLSPEHIEAIVKSKTKDREAKQLLIRIGGEPIKVREQCDKIFKFILWSSKFVSPALGAQPYAALALSGVSILLSLVLNSSKQNDAIFEGLAFISDLLHLYSYKESIYLRDEDKPAPSSLMKAIEALYANIFEFQARLICHLSRSTFKRGLRSTLELDDWEGMLSKIKNSDDRCNQYDELFSKEKHDRFSAEVSSYNEQSIDIQKRIYDEFEISRISRQQERQDDKEAELLQDLASDYKSDKDSISARVPGTCEWFFEDDRFLKWRDSKFSRLLWVSAGPGCGKSVLSRALIDERRVCTNAMTSTICYFFFKDGHEQRTRGANALCAMLHQLFEKTTLISHALSSHRGYGNKLRDTFSELWEILVKSVNDPEAGEIICVLDALDECEEDARNQLISKLVGFFSQKQPKEKPSATLKFLVTSRPYDDLEGKFQQLSGVGTYMRFDGDEKSQKIGQEIDLVIDAKIPDIAGDFTREDRNRIAERLKSMNNRTYLWLFLTIEIIERSRSNYRKFSSIDTLLSNLPSKISDAYERILAKSSNKEHARILLQLIVAATRPLSLKEVNIALTLATQKEHCTSYKALKSELWPLQNFRSTVQNMCGLFVSVHDGKLSLIHQTAREFLVRNTEPRSNYSNEWQGCFDMATAHGVMFNTCLVYLNFDNFVSTSGERYNDDDDTDDTDDLKNHRFLHYASINWTSHYVFQHRESAKNSLEAVKMLCDTTFHKPAFWFQIYCSSRYQSSYGWNSLAIAAWLGLEYVVESFLDEGAYINEEVNDYGNALQAASSAGHDQVVTILLNKGADVNAQGGEYANALYSASFKGHENIVQILLENGADVNAQGGRYSNALQTASYSGHKNIVQILLENGADVNAQGGIYGNALQATSYRGHENIVQMLLEKGANVNAQVGIYGTALQAASYEGHENIVQILLENEADVNAQRGKYGNALQAASYEGHENIVQILLENEADVNAQVEDYGNALQTASFRGHENIVQMLLEKGANVNAQERRYGNALQAASYGGHENIVQILLKKGANVNAQERRYGNALQVASFGGHEKIVQILLENGADVNAQGGTYGNALNAASRGRHRNITQLLRNKGAKYWYRSVYGVN